MSTNDDIFRSPMIPAKRRRGRPRKDESRSGDPPKTLEQDEPIRLRMRAHPNETPMTLIKEKLKEKEVPPKEEGLQPFPSVDGSSDRSNIESKDTPKEKAIQFTHQQISERFLAIQEDRLFGDLLEHSFGSQITQMHLTGKQRSRKYAPRDTKEEKIKRIRDVMKALEHGYDELNTFEYFNFQLDELATDEVEVKVWHVLFKKGEINGMAVKNFEGILKKVKEIHKNFVSHGFNNNDNIDAAFLVARITAEVKVKGRGRNAEAETIEQTFYGVKPIGKADKDDFYFICESSGIQMITKDEKISFDISVSMDSWMSNRNRLEEIYSKTRALAQFSTPPFIAYELSDIHIDEDWNAIREINKKLNSYILKEDTSPENIIRFVDCLSNDQETVLFECRKGMCPFLFVEYNSLEEHLERLKRVFYDFDLHLRDDITVEIRLKKDSRPKEPILTFAPGEPLPVECLPHHIQMIPVPGIKTGDNGTPWFRHYSDVEWKKVEARQIIHTYKQNPDAIEYMVFLSDFFFDHENEYGPGGLRYGFLHFFDEYKDRILKLKKGPILAAGFAFKLMEINIFNEDDNEFIFKRFTSRSPIK